MSAEAYAAVDKALLHVSAARERVEAAARSAAAEEDAEPLVEALEEADRELLAVHRRLLERAYFGASSEPQLALDAA
ncbi:MAG: hypothetical protein ABR521_12035 [Gaiellaceae bacterium]